MDDVWTLIGLILIAAFLVLIGLAFCIWVILDWILGFFGAPIQVKIALFLLVMFFLITSMFKISIKLD